MKHPGACHNKPSNTLVSAIVALALFGVVLAAAFGASLWPGTVVSGQTVPRTPPPTFTATPSATPLLRPSNTPQPTATATYRPNVPTPTPQADPVFELTADRAWAGPGDLITISSTIWNRGGAPANQAVLVVTVPDSLAIAGVDLSQGTASTEPGRITCALGALPSQVTTHLVLRLRVPQDADPGHNLVFSAVLTYDRGTRTAQDVSVGLPPALLPNTGP